MNIETNGLLTYHRKPKVVPGFIAVIHEALFSGEVSPQPELRTP